MSCGRGQPTHAACRATARPGAAGSQVEQLAEQVSDLKIQLSNMADIQVKILAAMEQQSQLAVS